MPERTFEQEPPILKLDLDKLKHEIISRRDTSPKHVMSGEVAESEEVDFNLDINGKKYNATLYRSDYLDSAPSGYTVQMSPKVLILKDSSGNQINLKNEDRDKLMDQLDETIREADKTA